MSLRAMPSQRTYPSVSGWRVAFSGSEFVRKRTLDRFAARFRPAGFRRCALMPCYGLAEATLFVSGDTSSKRPVCYQLDTAALSEKRIVQADKGTELVACGEVAVEVVNVGTNLEAVRLRHRAGVDPRPGDDDHP